MTELLDSYIGWWAFRPGTSKFHLIESEVTDRLVTRCGRQMHLELHDVPLVFEASPQGEVCVFCATRKREHGFGAIRDA